MQKQYLAIGAVVFVAVLSGFLILRQNRTAIPNPPPESQTTTSNTPSSPPPSVQVQTSQGVTIESAGLMLEVSFPKDKTIVKQALVTVIGKTSPKAEVTVNDKDLKADASGNFSTSISLDEGENTITIIANDDNGNYAEREIEVSYEPTQ